MQSFKTNIRTTHLVIGGHLIAFIMLVSTCDSKKSESKLTGIIHPSGQEFAGSESCVQCHQSIADSHSSTPHFLTSRPGEIETLKGSFDSGENVLVLNERLKVVMEKTPSGLFQHAFVDGAEVDKKPIDMTIGSGRQGQTYLYWKDDALFQLPASYHALADSWSNSPGYPTDQILFNRNIPARCMECHSTYLKIGKTIAGVETFDKKQTLLGVDCERCHGPSARHVNFHLQNPGEKDPRHVINPAKLTRQQRLDNCALCHSGIRDNFMPSFSFMVGDNLADFSYPTYTADSAATLDVHGNQYGLLAASKCFRMSELDCSSCHNVHLKETDKLEVFSSRCMNCHNKGTEHFCTQPAVPGLVLSNNCIDCHMPELPSRQVFVQGLDRTKSTPFFVRTHLVGNYEKQIKLFLEKIQQDSLQAK